MPELELPARLDPAHGDDFPGLVLSGSAGRDLTADRSDLDVVVVLTDEAARDRSTVRSPEVDEAGRLVSDLSTVVAFVSEHWWFRWTYAWAPVPAVVAARAPPRRVAGRGGPRPRRTDPRRRRRGDPRDPRRPASRVRRTTPARAHAHCDVLTG